MATESIKRADVIEDLTITRTENSYFNTTSIGRLNAHKRSGNLSVKLNLINSSALVAMSDFIEIAQISGWNATNECLVNIPAQQDGSNVICIRISATGVMSFYSSNAASSGRFFRTQLSVTSAD